MEQQERRAVTPGGLVKITIQVTPDQLAEMDRRTGQFGSRADLIRGYIEQGLERDRRTDQLLQAAAV